MKSFKKITINRLPYILLLSAITVINSAAQDQRNDRIDAYRIGFFTKRLNLSSKEAQVFWPVYNDYQDKKTQVQLGRRALIREFNQSAGTLSEKELTAIGDKLLDATVRESALAVDLHKKLKEILPPAKVIRFYQVENLYRAQLLRELQNRMQQDGKQGLRPNEDIDPDL